MTVSKGRDLRAYFVFAACLSIFSTITSNTANAEEQPTVQSILSTAISRANVENGLVGLAGAVMQDGHLIATAGAGMRRKSGSDPIQADDKFHVGSVGKSMTASVIMRLVERSLLDLDKPVAAYLPDYHHHPDWGSVSLAQLLIHTAGVRRDFPGSLFEQEPDAENRSAHRRSAAVRSILAEGLRSDPGDKHSYSNAGFTVIGHVAEVATGKRWSTLIREEIWNPLDLTSAGFGPPRDDGNGAQPWGHRPMIYRTELWGFPAIGPIREKDPSTPEADLTAMISPAGLYHMNMADLARFGYGLLKGELLQKESIEFLLTGELDIGAGLKYTNGSMLFDTSQVIKTEDANTYWTTGWNSTFVGFLMILPDQKVALSLATNDGRFSKARLSFIEIAETVSSALRELPE